MSSYQDVLILGDFNIPWNIIDNMDTISLMELAELYGLKQHVCMSTHTSGNMLDLMFSTLDSRLKLSKPRSSYFISDHCFIAGYLNITAYCNKEENHVQTREQLQAQRRISPFPTAPGINAVPLVIFCQTYRLHAVGLPIFQIVF